MAKQLPVLLPSAYHCLFCAEDLWYDREHYVLVHGDGHSYQPSQHRKERFVPEHTATPALLVTEAVWV